MPFRPDPAVCDTICYTALSLSTVGVTSVALAILIYFIWNMELTPFDASVLVWLFVALAISVTVLFVAFYLKCCPWKYSKMVLAIIYAVYDVALLVAAIAVFTMKSSILGNLGSMWNKDPESAFVRYLEGKLKCHGFSGPEEGTCEGPLTDLLSKSSGWVGGVLIALFLVLLAGVIIAFYRALAKRKPAPDDVKSQEMAQIQAQLNEGGTMWF
jgi:Na+-transporting methylmalonyl-CoA/oxaloacetate decarboxylase gamma subunit